MTTRAVLLVDDNPDDVALAEAAFAKLGVDHRLVVATDGEEAVQELSDDARELPDLVLLDLKLPGIDGFEVLRLVRESARTAVLPVVVLTSSIEERDVLASYRLGANSYLRKPTDFDEFVRLMRQIVDYWLVANETAGSGDDA